ncbi:MAG: hypothetical protein B6242_11610 [Anaerolineaceae bacterium 4572_78]|nr:MAG: hypothetical protein B6242_11610 [Anaerolineaceae bacterium 4572_78]
MMQNKPYTQKPKIDNLIDIRRNRNVWARLRYEEAERLMKLAFGKRRQNIEWAIEFYKESLHGKYNIKGFTKEEYPQQWAMVKNALGNTYQERIEKGRERNIYKAIQCYQEALTVLIKKDVQRANVLINLALAHDKKRYTNPQNIIDYYSESIEIYRLKKLDDKRADAQYNFILFMSIQPLDNNLIVNHLKKGLKQFTREYNPERWAKLHYTLSTVYNGHGNSKQAIYHALECFKFYKQHTYPIQWAMTHHQLGLAYEGLHTTSMNSK